MNTFVPLAAVGFGASVLLSIFYWQIFRAVMLRSLRFRLFALRDEARRVASEKGLGDSLVFHNLERFICGTISFVPHTSLFSFISCSLSPDDSEKNQYERFQKEAPQEFIGMRDATAKYAIVTMMLNSPWLMLFSSFAVPILWAAGKISRVRLYRGAENLVENISLPAPC
jgi:hypothetical protein